MANDVERFLANEPIEARPASGLYRLKKMYQRNRLAVASTMIVAATLIFATVFSIDRAVKEATMRGQLDGALTEMTILREEALETAERETKLRKTAEQKTREAQWKVYVGTIRLMNRALNEGDFGRLSELVQQSTPKDDDPDFRGWEWFYLKEQLQARFDVLQESVSAFAVNRENDQIALGIWESDQVVIRDRTNQQTLRSFHVDPTPEVTALAFSHDGSRLAIGNEGGEISVIDLDRIGVDADDTVSARFNGDEGITKNRGITQIDWRIDDTRLAYGTRNGLIAVCDLQSNSLNRIREGTGEPW